MVSALWKCLGHFAIQPTFDCYNFTWVLLEGSCWIKTQELMKAEYFSGSGVLGNAYCTIAYFENLRGHIHVFLLIPLFSVNCSWNNVMSLPAALSIDISCNVIITRGALLSASKGTIFCEAGTYFLFFQKLCVCLACRYFYDFFIFIVP